jgi:exonuclease SbcC
LITRIELTNFMSHKSTVIEPAAGLTVLVGPNNCGKSAVAEALRTICGFSRGDYMVRHGESTASVTLTTSEGSTVKWTRKKDTVSWQVDGREIHRDEPEDLHEKLRLPLVSTEGGRQEFSVHLADQKQPLFLLGMPASAPALFFAASSDARHLIAMRQAHKKRIQDLTAKRKGTVGELERVNQLLETLDPVPTLEARLAETETNHQRLLAATTLANSLERDWETLVRARQERAGLGALASALEPLQAPPSLEDSTPLGLLCETLATATQDQVSLGQKRSVLRPLAPPPALGPADDLERLIDEMTAVGASRTYHLDTAGALDDLPVPPPLPDPTPLQGTLRDLVEWNGQKRLAAEQVASLKELAPPPGLAPDEALAAVLAQLQSEAAEVSFLSQRASTLEAIAVPPVLTDPEPLQYAIGCLRESEWEAGLRRQQAGILDRLHGPPLPKDVEPLLKLLEDLWSAMSGLQSMSDEVGGLDEQEKLLRGEILAWLETNGSCPACGQVLNEVVITSGGFHGH